MFPYLFWVAFCSIYGIQNVPSLFFDLIQAYSEENYVANSHYMILGLQKLEYRRNWWLQINKRDLLQQNLVGFFAVNVQLVKVLTLSNKLAVKVENKKISSYFNNFVAGKFCR